MYKFSNSFTIIQSMFPGEVLTLYLHNCESMSIRSPPLNIVQLVNARKSIDKKTL